MKPTFRAGASRFELALLGALALGAGPASAEGVKIDGLLDLGLQSVERGTTKHTGVDSGTYAPSRVIIRGGDDLGGGLRAYFYLEHRLNADEGESQSAKFWSGGSYVGLSSTRYGSVTLGRQYVPIFWPFQWADDSGNAKLHNYSAVQSIERGNLARVRSSASPIGSGGSLDSINGGIYTLRASSSYEDNLVVYKSLSFSHMTVSVAIGMPEGYPNGAGDILGGNVEYRKGGTYVGFGLNSKTGRVPAGGTREAKLTETLLSGMYTVNRQVQVWGNLHKWDFDSDGDKLNGQDYMVGVSYQLPISMVWVNYAAKNIDNCTDCNSSGFGVGYHYLLSKNVELYAAMGNVTNERNSATSLNGFAPSAPGQTVRGLAAGVYYNF